MSSKIIFMDGVATARLRDDGSIRIELDGEVSSPVIWDSLFGVMSAIRRSRPSEMGQPVQAGYGAQAVQARPGSIRFEGGDSPPAAQADRAS